MSPVRLPASGTDWRARGAALAIGMLPYLCYPPQKSSEDPMRSVPFRLYRLRARTLAVAITLSVTSAMLSHASTCTSDDIASGAAEHCAKQEASLLLRCLRVGIAPASCDTSTARDSCAHLSPSCNVVDEVAT